MGRISPGPTRWPPGAERRLVPAKSNLKPETPFAALASTMKNDEVLAIADPKDRELVWFSVGETFHANVKILQALVPRPQSTGPRDTYIVRRVCQGPPFWRWRRGVREGGPLPPTWDLPAVVVGDEEGNTFMGESYCPQVTINSFWNAKKNTKKREEHSAMFRGRGRGANPKHFFFMISDFATVKVGVTEKSRVCPHEQTRRCSGRCPASSSCPLCTHWAGRCAKSFGTRGTWGT